MLSPRNMIAGAAIIAGITLAGFPAHGCDVRFPWTCPAPPEQASSTAKPESPAAQPRKTATRAARLAERSKKRALAHRSRPSNEAKPGPRAVPVPASRPMSTAARRFREFVNPRPMAANPVDDLQKPRLDPSNLAGLVTYPAAAASKLQIGPSDARAADGDQAFSQDELNELDLAAVQVTPLIRISSTDVAFDAPAAVQDPVTEVRKTAPADRTPASSTWVQLIFVTWGGLLTLASALRLFIG